MDKVFKTFKDYLVFRRSTVDSLIYRLHYQFTLPVLIVLSLTVTLRQHLGDPIDCISKDDIPNKLLDTYCWIHTTFSVEDAWFKKVGKEVPYPGVEKFTKNETKVYHAYYQWVCFMLLFQGLLFYVPHYTWKCSENGRMKKLIKSLADTHENTLLVGYLKNNMRNHTFYGTMYNVTEIMNLVNVLVQIYLMDIFLGGEFTSYGTEVLSFTEWDYKLRYDPMIKVFPRLSKCTFHRYGSSGDVQKHDAMCVIPINILNEKIYIFLWFWFLILTILTALEMLYRAMLIAIPGTRSYILRLKCRAIDKKRLEIVLNKCDRNDYFVLSLLCKNMSSYSFKTLINDLATELQN